MDSIIAEDAVGMHKFVDPVAYLAAFVSHGIRPDGRLCSSSRNIVLNVGSISTANGSAMIKLGNTCVLSAVKMELSTPPQDCPSRGYLVSNVEHTSSSLPQVGSGPPSAKAQSLSQSLQDVLSEYVNCEALCLVESKLCWTVYVYTVCLCNDGNIWDACVLASTAALINTQVPTVDIDDDSPVVSISSANNSLKLGTVCLATTFGIFMGEYLIDPSNEEEKICDGVVSVMYGDDGTITQIIHKGNGILLVYNYDYDDYV